MAVASITKNKAMNERRAFELRPTRDLVFIKRITEETAGKDSTIVLSEYSKERALVGDVIAVGPECVRVKIGDRVLFARYSGKEFFEDLPMSVYGAWRGVLYMNEEDIIATQVAAKE